MRPCSGSKKWCGLQLELDVLDQPVVDHQRAEQRRLRLDILREGSEVLLTRTRRCG